MAYCVKSGSTPDDCIFCTFLPTDSLFIEDDFNKVAQPEFRQKLNWCQSFNHDYLVCTRITPVRDGFRTIQTRIFDILLTQRPINIAADSHIPTAEITAVLEILKLIYYGGPFDQRTICVALWSSKRNTAMKDFHLFIRSAKLLITLLIKLTLLRHFLMTMAAVMRLSHSSDQV